MPILTDTAESGNLISCEELCQRYYPSVHRRVHFLVYRSPITAVDRELLVEDLVQETFYHAVRSHSRLTHNEHINAWLWRIATNLFYDYLRRYKSQRFDALCLEEVDNLADEQSDPAEQYQASEFDGPFGYAWRKTSYAHRQVLVLIAQGYKSREVAEKLGTTPPEIYNVLKEARRAFKRRLVLCQEVA